MADRYWVGGTANWNGTAASKWSTTSGGAGGAAEPTAADDVFLNAASGAVTVTIDNVNAACRSLDCNGFTGTLAYGTTTRLLSIGTTTVPASNIALRLSSGMTYTAAVGNVISFVGTNTTAQTITTNGKTMPGLTFSGAGGSWKFLDAVTATGATITHTAGTLDTNGQTISAAIFSGTGSTARTLTLGSSAITLTSTSTYWAFATITNLTMTANTAVVTHTGAGGTWNSGAMNWNGLSLVENGSGACVLTGGGGTYNNLTRNGTAVKTDSWSIASAAVVTGALTLAGNSATNRLLVASNTVGTARTFTANGTIVASNVDFMDITGIGTASWNLSAITGGSGDALGNSGLTFTTGTTLYNSAAGTLDSTSAWSTSSGGATGARVPLPQDNAVIDGTTGTRTLAMPRMCANLTVSNTLIATISIGSVTPTIYGSFTWGTGAVHSGLQTWNLQGRGSHTITPGGQSVVSAVNINAPGGTYTLQGPWQIDRNSSNALIVTAGTLDANNQNVTIGSSTANAGVQTASGASLVMGTGTWTLLGTGTITIWNASSSATISAASATIIIGAASANTRTFNGGGASYGTLTYTVAGSTGTLVITGSNTFGTINFSDATNARILQFTAATTTTVTTFNVFGTAGKLMSVQSVTAATHTLSKPSGTVSEDYLSLTNSIATGGAAWYAGANSTNVSGNTGWVFTAPPPDSGKFFPFVMAGV